MAAKAKVKWNMEADYLQACSCDYGCPCEFEAPPTRGFCEGMGVWRINRGRYGDLSLAGLHLGFLIHFPGPMHEGNGTGTFLIDELANPKQREALVTIASGKAGGMPFEVFAALVTQKLDPQFVRFQLKLAGRNSSVKAGKALDMAFEPIKNPVTGEPEKVRVEHETGFIFKSADCVSARECRSSVPGLSFSWPHKAGFVSRIKYGN